MNSAKTAEVPATKSCAAYFFGTCLALATSFFFWLAAATFACFCAAALLVAFGDLSPIGTRLRCTATGVNSTDGNVPTGLPHRGPSRRRANCCGKAQQSNTPVLHCSITPASFIPRPMQPQRSTWNQSACDRAARGTIGFHPLPQLAGESVMLSAFLPPSTS